MPPWSRAAEGDAHAREELEAINGIGPAVAEALVEFFKEEHNREVVEDLASLLEVEDATADGASDVCRSPARR